MCTVSIVAPSGQRGLRLLVNRDERRSRAAAWPPQLVERPDVAALWPVDSEARGTWVAVNDHGVVFALVNRHDGRTLMPHPPARSRGHVIPAVASAVHLVDAQRLVGALDVAPFAPFRLVIAHGDGLLMHDWDGERVEVSRRQLRAPAIISSSSLGDALVEQPREALFRSLLERYADAWVAQDHLHQHSWPDRRHLSVLMSRDTAQTVCRTTVVVGASEATMTFAPVVDGWIGPVVTRTVARRDAQVALSA